MPGLIACQVHSDLMKAKPTGHALPVSGSISLDPKTGAEIKHSLQIQLVSEKSDLSKVMFHYSSSVNFH